MWRIKGRRVYSHIIVVLVLISFGLVDSFRQSQWHYQDASSPGDPKGRGNIGLRSTEAKTIEAEGGVAADQQVSKERVLNNVYQVRTDDKDRTRASSWPGQRASDGDHVSLASYERAAEASSSSQSSSSSQAQSRVAPRLSRTRSRGTTTNLHRPRAGQVRPAHRVITGREGQQHIPSQGRDAARIAGPYNQRVAASSASLHPRQHLSSLTSRDNAGNLWPEGFEGLGGYHSGMNPLRGYQTDHHVGRQQAKRREPLNGGHHVGQTQVTLITHGQKTQPHAHHGQINDGSHASYSHSNSRSIHPDDLEKSAKQENNFPENYSTIQTQREAVTFSRPNNRHFDEPGGDSSTEIVEEQQIRFSFLRQSEALNPLSIRRPISSPSSGGRPGALTSTNLAHEHHRNVSYVDLANHTEPERTPTTKPPITALNYDEGGPVNPSQLLLQSLDARPIAPGRPPSNVIAQPSPIVPESLLGSTEPPPATLSFVRNNTDHNTDGGAPPSAIDPGTLQINGAQGGQNLGPSPFFSGAPLRPSYVYTTQRPPRPPVDPASLLIASGFTTRPPITVPPAGYNPLLSTLQKLDVVHVDDNPNPSALDIPSPQETLAALGGEYPWQNTRPPSIPGRVPPASPFQEPFVISNNTAVQNQNAAPVLDLIDDNIAFDVLQQISGHSGAASTQPLRPVPTQEEQFRPQQVIPNRPFSNFPQPSNNGYFPPPNPSAYPYPSGDNFLNSNPQFLSSNPNSPAGYPNVRPGYPNPPGSYPNNPAVYPNRQPGYNPYLNPHRPFGNLQYPGYGAPYPASNNAFANPNQYPPPHPRPLPGQGPPTEEAQPSASVAASVTNKVSSADSEAEGGDGVVSTSTTVIKGGSSTSNNNFYRPRPGSNQGTSAVSPAAISIPPEVAPVPASSSSTRPRPPIFIDGIRNETATPSDVFPDSNVNVACSRRHGCPAFILRTRPAASQPEDERKNTFIFDEAVERRPNGNINIACDFQEGCPTYIINTTPDPQRVRATTFAPPTPPRTISPSAPPPPPPPPPPIPPPLAQQAAIPADASATKEEELLQAIGLVLDLLNKTEGIDFEDNNESLTGDFDYIFEAAGIDGFDNLLSHTPGLAPPINPQNIRPGLQIIPAQVSSTTISPLAQHLGQQSRPHYDVVRVPEKTVLNSPSLSHLLDNKRVFSVNPLQTRTPGDTAGLTSNYLGQPGSFDLLQNRLVQAHLDALQENGLGVTSPDPLGAYGSEVGSLNDAQMGGVAATERPSLASILNLEPQKIPNEPPLVEAPSSDDHHHHNMMRHVLAATFMGLPMTTALMSALGAPVALMAPLGLAIPALLTMGFMDVNSNQGNFGHHFRRPLHAHGHHAHHDHHTPDASTTDSSPSSTGSQESSTADAPSSNTNSQDSRGDGRMDLMNGGGFAGALRRLGGMLPKMVSNIASRMGARSARHARRRREAQEKASGSDLAGGDGGGESETPTLQLSNGDLATLRDMNRLYSSLSKANTTQAEKPSPEEVLLHRKYLLSLLKQLRNRHQGAASTQNSGLTSLTSEPVKENSTSVLVTDQASSVLTGNTGGTSVPLNGSQTSNDGPTIHSSNFLSHNTDEGVNRIGQTSPDNADIQNIDAEAAALLLHQFQTQGSSNLLPPSFLGHVPPTTPPPTKFDLLLGQQPEQGNEEEQMAVIGIESLFTQEFPRGEAKFLAARDANPNSKSVHLTPASALGSNLPSLKSPTPSSLPLHSPGSEAVDIVQDILPVPHYIDRNSQAQPQAQPEPEISPNLAVNAFGHPFFETSQVPVDTEPDFIPAVEQEPFSYPSSDLLIHPPTEYVPEHDEGPFLDPIPDSGSYNNYEVMLQTLQLLRELNALRSSTLNRVDLGSSSFLDQDSSLLPSPGNVNLDYLYDQDYLQYAALSNPVPNTRLTTEANDAFTTFAQNIADAISTFLTDIGAAIAAQPALLLLGLIPFALLVFSLYHVYGPKHGGGYGGGGGGGHGYSSGGNNYRRGNHGRDLALEPHLEALETLSRIVLFNMEYFERKFASELEDGELK